MAVFDPQRCSRIDQTSTTAIWRGNLPLNQEGSFAYHEMAVTLDLDVDTVLVDVSVLDNIKGSERDPWLIELGAYGVDASLFSEASDIPPQFNQPNWNPGCLLGEGIKRQGGSAPGHLVWWQIEGGANEITLGPSSRSYNFIGFLEYLGRLRTVEKGLIYIHCMNGTDRTGATVAAYGLRYLGMDLDRAMTFAASVPQAGVMSEDYQMLVKSYADWLAQNKPV